MRNQTGPRALVAAFVGVVAGVLLPAMVHAQYAVVTGRVTAQKGYVIQEAQVYINDLNAVVKTSAKGDFELILDSTRVKGQQVNLRVRALGFVPGVKIIRLSPGKQTVNFELQADTVRRLDEVFASQMPPGMRVAYPRPRAEPQSDLAQGLAAGATPLQADPFGRLMFTPELLMQYQDAISLEDGQRLTIQTAMQEAQQQVIKMQWALALDSEKLSKMLGATSLDEKEVLAQIDRILAIEREIKRAQMTLMIRIKNTLTPAQQSRLRQLRG